MYLPVYLYIPHGSRGPTRSLAIHSQGKQFVHRRFLTLTLCLFLFLPSCWLSKTCAFHTYRLRRLVAIIPDRCLIRYSVKYIPTAISPHLDDCCDAFPLYQE